MQTELVDATWKQEAPLTVGGVLAVWLQNFGGGLGAATLAGVLCWQMGLEAGAAARWALLAGAVVFGGLMVLRSAIDEIVDVADYRRLIGDLEAAEEQVELLEQQNASLRRDLHAAETYGAYRAARPGVVVQDRNGEPMPAAAPLPEVNDAKTLIQRHFDDGKWPAKDRMNVLLGWSSTRWFAARDVLQAHGIIASQGRNTVVLVGSLAEALAVLSGDKS